MNSEWVILLSTISGAIMGSVITIVYDFYKSNKQNKEFLIKNIYEPLRQELSHNQHLVWHAEDDIVKTHFNSIYYEEFISFKLKPNLKRRIENVYNYGIHNLRITLRNLEPLIVKDIMAELKISSDNQSIAKKFARNIITGKNNLNPEYTTGAFAELKKIKKVKEKNYEELKLRLITSLSNKTYHEHYLEKRDLISNEISKLINKLDNLMGNKQKVFTI